MKQQQQQVENLKVNTKTKKQQYCAIPSVFAAFPS